MRNQIKGNPQSTKETPKVTGYSQDVLDYQGRANGFYTYAKAWRIWMIGFGALIVLLSPLNNDQTILAPQAPPPDTEEPVLQDNEEPVLNEQIFII